MDIKKLLELGGKSLVLVSFGFLFYILSTLDFTVLLSQFSLIWLPFIMIAAVAFSLLYFFMAQAWKLLLEMLEQKHFDNHIVAVYLQTVIYKYVPGNVFHFLGRHTLKKSHDVGHKKIVLANTLEIILQLIAVSFLIMIGTLFFDIALHVSEYIALSRTTVFTIFSILILGGLVLIWRKEYRDYIFSREKLIIMIKVLLYHSIFLIASALLLAVVYFMILEVPFSKPIMIETIFVSIIAWLVGFVIPGAPGGIGVREAILLLLLPSILLVSKEIVILGALIYRIVTILGEALTYFWAKLFENKG